MTNTFLGTEFYGNTLPPACRVHLGFSGHFTLVRRKAADESVVEVREFDNLITDAGLNRLGVGATVNRCQVGSGTNPPQITDTAIQTLVATSVYRRNLAAPYTYFSYDAAARFQTYTCTFRFDLGVAVGVLSEIAMGWSETPAGIWCRSLIKDGGGNPITLTVLADEILDVYYTVKIQYPAADGTGMVNVNGTDYAWASRPANIGSSNENWGRIFGQAMGGPVSTTPGDWVLGYTYYGYTGAMGAVTSTPSTGNLGSNSKQMADAYVLGSFSRTLTCIMQLDDCVGSIRSILIYAREYYYNSTVFYWQIEFSPPIVKSDKQELRMKITLSWGRS
jgi:hypothetical protein